MQPPSSGLPHGWPECGPRRSHREHARQNLGFRRPLSMRHPLDLAAAARLGPGDRRVLEHDSCMNQGMYLVNAKDLPTRQLPSLPSLLALLRLHQALPQLRCPPPLPPVDAPIQSRAWPWALICPARLVICHSQRVAHLSRQTLMSRCAIQD